MCCSDTQGKEFKLKHFEDLVFTILLYMQYVWNMNIVWNNIITAANSIIYKLY